MGNAIKRKRGSLICLVVRASLISLLPKLYEQNERKEGRSERIQRGKEKMTSSGWNHYNQTAMKPDLPDQVGADRER